MQPFPFRHLNPAGPAYRRGWVDEAVAAIEADQCRTADTHLIRLIVPALAGIDIYLKDESTHPTGSLKHRLARSLFLYGLCNGPIRESTPGVEASSGSTAVSEAYFAQMIGVSFYAVMPRTTSAEKIAAIEHYGGNCHLIDEAARCMRRPARWPHGWAATTWTSSPSRSAPPTGAATTTSPNPSSRNCRASRAHCQTGS